MIQSFSQTEAEFQGVPGLDALVDGLVAFLAVGLVAIGTVAVLIAMN